MDNECIPKPGYRYLLVIKVQGIVWPPLWVLPGENTRFHQAQKGAGGFKYVAIRHYVLYSLAVGMAVDRGLRSQHPHPFAGSNPAGCRAAALTIPTIGMGYSA